MPTLRSVVKSTAGSSLSSLSLKVSKKDGQPDPESNFVDELQYFIERWMILVVRRPFYYVIDF